MLQRLQLTVNQLTTKNIFDWLFMFVYSLICIDAPLMLI